MKKLILLLGFLCLIPFVANADELPDAPNKSISRFNVSISRVTPKRVYFRINIDGSIASAGYTTPQSYYYSFDFKRWGVSSCTSGCATSGYLSTLTIVGKPSNIATNFCGGSSDCSITANQMLAYNGNKTDFMAYVDVGNYSNLDRLTLINIFGAAATPSSFDIVPDLMTDTSYQDFKSTVNGVIYNGLELYVPDADGDGVFDVNDCAPADNTKWQNLSGYLDEDGDLYTTGSSTIVCSGASLASPYILANTVSDCAPADNTKWRLGDFFVDSDLDGYGDGSTQNVCYGSSVPSGYSLTMMSLPLGVNLAVADTVEKASGLLPLALPIVGVPVLGFAVFKLLKMRVI